MHIMSLSPVLVGVGVILVGMALRDYLKTEGKLTPARQTWLTVAFIFTVIGMALYFADLFFPESR